MICMQIYVSTDTIIKAVGLFLMLVTTYVLLRTVRSITQMNKN